MSAPPVAAAAPAPKEAAAAPKEATAAPKDAGPAQKVPPALRGKETEIDIPGKGMRRYIEVPEVEVYTVVKARMGFEDIEFIVVD